MRVDWGRELWTWAQYALFTFVSATAALLYQAASDFDRAGDVDDGMISCFFYSTALAGAGVFYGWLLDIFLTLSAVRFLVLIVSSRIGEKSP